MSDPIPARVPTVDELTPGDVLDQLDDVAAQLWPLVDAVAAAVYAADDGPRRLELRAVQEHTAQAWAQAQHAATVLKTLVALDVPDAACETCWPEMGKTCELCQR